MITLAPIFFKPMDSLRVLFSCPPHPFDDSVCSMVNAMLVLEIHSYDVHYLINTNVIKTVAYLASITSILAAGDAVPLPLNYRMLSKGLNAILLFIRFFLPLAPCPLPLVVIVPRPPVECA